MKKTRELRVFLFQFTLYNECELFKLMKGSVPIYANDTTGGVFSLEFHEIIKQYRLQSGLTQQHVADQLHVHHNTYSQYERGTRRIDVETFAKLSCLFHMDLNAAFQPYSLEQLFSRYPRDIRTIGKNHGKSIHFVTQGDEILVSRKILRELEQPLTHLIRNSVYHGIETVEERKQRGKNETGTLSLLASVETNILTLIVEDDGIGIDKENIKQKGIEKGLFTHDEWESLTNHEQCEYLFVEHLFTSEIVTPMAGRGTGLPRMKQYIKEANGTITVESEPGLFTRFTMQIPLH